VKSINDITVFVNQYPGALVEITGGEPLLQPAVLRLADTLVQAGRTVLIETNGSLDIAPIPPGVITILDIKCPDSGMSGQVLWDNLSRLGPQDEIKFVLSSRADYDWALQCLDQHTAFAEMDPGKILFSPVTDALSPEDLAQWMLTDRPSARLQLQLHKQIWPDCQRGV
jgi:7-carboxy-7-deazaguanine synthase